MARAGARFGPCVIAALLSFLTFILVFDCLPSLALGKNATKNLRPSSLLDDGLFLNLFWATSSAGSGYYSYPYNHYQQNEYQRQPCPRPQDPGRKQQRFDGSCHSQILNCRSGSMGSIQSHLFAKLSMPSLPQHKMSLLQHS